MSKKALVSLFGVVAVIAVALLVWLFQPISHQSNASQTLEFELQVKYDKFRQIMVRKNATEAIVSHGGMKIVSEGVEDLQLDLSGDDRPILNAILGKSKAEVDATKLLTVEINNDQVDTEQLTLRSRALVDSERLQVESKSVGEQGQVKNYVTSITATPQGDATLVQLALEMAIEVNVPSMFTGVADKKVNEAAGAALEQQKEAITAFVIEHADKRIVFPQLN